jgi:hypothetical protein
MLLSNWNWRQFRPISPIRSMHLHVMCCTLGLSVWLFYLNIISLSVVIFTGMTCFHLYIVVHHVTGNDHNSICRCRQAYNNRLLPAVKSVMTRTSPLTFPIILSYQVLCGPCAPSHPVTLLVVEKIRCFRHILEQCDIS